MFKHGVLFAICIVRAFGQSIEPRHPLVVRVSKSALTKPYNFGASMTAVIKQKEDPVFFIGAPSYGEPVAGVRPGALFRCLTSDSACSRRLETSKSGSVGIAMDSLQSGKGILVCGTGYSTICSHSTIADHLTQGACFQANVTGAYEVPNPCAAASTCPNTLLVDIMFVMDESGSVRKQHFTKALLWVNKVMANFRNEINTGHVWVGVVKFASNARVSVVLEKRSYTNFEESVTNIRYLGGGTQTNKGIELAATHFEANGRSSQGIPQLMVIVTDGRSRSLNLTATAAKNAREQNITMVAVGVGSTIRNDELEKIAGNTSRVLRVTDFNQLGSILTTLTQVITASANVQLEGKVSNATYEFLNCQFGLSIHTPKNFSPLVGAVGSYDRAGSFAAYQSLDKLPPLLNLTGLETIMSPENITQLRESYLGYSITSGMLYGNTIESIASGSPRYQARGQVIILPVDQIKNPVTAYFSLHPNGLPWQLGAYYGHSVLTIDLNNDAYDDLLVSAPLYSDVKGYDQGRVFVYMNDPNNPGPEKWVSENYTAITLSGSNAVGARFGMSITAVGDVDKNNFIDIVIGAPREALTSSSSGAIYLYYGSAQGLSENYKQRLIGKEVEPGLDHFGYAFVKTASQQGVDVNSDTYPDIVVSAPASDRVYALHSRPILDVNASVTITPTTVDLLGCLNLGGQSCAKVTVCTSANLRGPSSIPAGTEMTMTLSLDSLVRLPSEKRAVFVGRTTAERSSIRTTSHLLTEDNSNCSTYDITLNGAVYSFTSEPAVTLPSNRLRVKLSYELKQVSLNRVLSPVIDPLAAKSHQSDWTLTTGCMGTDGTCIHDLSLTATSSISVSSEYYVIGAAPEVLTFNVVISNNGPEHSFYTTIMVQSPGLRLTLENNQCVVKSEASATGVDIIQINKALSTLENGAQCNLVFKFDLRDLTASATQNMLNITASIFSKSNYSEDPVTINNVFAFRRPLKYAVNMVLGSTSAPSQITFNNSAVGVHKEGTEPTSGENSTLFITHTFKINNRGPNSLSSAWFSFTWPNATIVGVPLLHLYEFTCLPSTWCQCELLPQFLTNISFPDQFIRSNMSTLSTTAIPAQTSCDVVSCDVITCLVFNQSKHTWIEAVAKFKLRLSYFKQKNLTSRLVSSIRINASASPIFPALSVTYIQASTMVSTWVGSRYSGSPSLNNGIIIGAITGGVVLLAILSIVLWKVGFFESKYRDKLTEAKIAAQDDDTVVGNLNRANADVTKSTVDLITTAH